MEWKEKGDGDFRNFEGKIIRGVSFRQGFIQPRNEDFPLDDLFQAIHQELLEGRLVIVGFTSANGWHNWVIHAETISGEFLAFPKLGKQTIEEHNVKAIITQMKGTDVGIYELG